MRDALVVNASPLIFLGNAAQLDLLRVIDFRRVLVPSSVFDEVTTSGHADRAARAVAEANWIERVSPPLGRRARERVRRTSRPVFVGDSGARRTQAPVHASDSRARRSRESDLRIGFI